MWLCQVYLNTKHGLSYSSEYRIWNGMIQRCTNPKQMSYRNYGGRGIVVCDRWHIFENFYADMGPRPSKKHSIDRFPDNIRQKIVDGQHQESKN